MEPPYCLLLIYGFGEKKKCTFFVRVINFKWFYTASSKYFLLTRRRLRKLIAIHLHYYQTLEVYGETMPSS